MFKQLLEELRKTREEVAKKVNDVKNLQQEVYRLTKENETLKQQIADHVCPTCNHEEEIEVLKAQVASIQAEKEEQAKQHEENVLALQEEIDVLKKLLEIN